MEKFTLINQVDPIIPPQGGDRGIDQIQSGDFNGDGNTDFVVVRINWKDLGKTASPLQIFVGDGNGGFTDQTATIFNGTIPYVNYVPRMSIADFNGDGKSDIFCIDSGFDAAPFTGGQNSLFLSTNDGHMVNATSNLPQVTQFNHGASIGDVNKDGRLDILVNALMHSGNDLQINTESGRFVSTPSLMPSLTKTNPYSGTGIVNQTHTMSGLIDMNNDGYLDMILGNWESPTSSDTSNLYLSNRGSFANVTPISLPNSGITDQIVLDIKPIDLNGDNLPDLALSISTGEKSNFYQKPYIQLLVNNGKTGFSDETQLRLPQSKTFGSDEGWYKTLTIVDLNHDGFSDIVADNESYKNAAEVFMNDGKGNFSLVQEFQPDQRITTGDVNNDGMTDLILGPTFIWTPTKQFQIFTNTMQNLHVYKANFGGEKLLGSKQNDWFISNTGDDHFDGNGGTDIAVFNGARSNYTISVGDDTTTVSDKGANIDGTDTLTEVTRLKFSDKTIALDISGNAGQTYRIYQAAFDRKPDNDGIKYWINARDNGQSLESVATGFIYSAEFRGLYGENPTTEQFVSKLYNNVLHRAPDSSGYQYWVDQVNSGAINWAQALVGFSESTENQVAVIGAIQNGIELI